MCCGIWQQAVGGNCNENLIFLKLLFPVFTSQNLKLTILSDLHSEFHFHSLDRDTKARSSESKHGVNEPDRPR